ncbi:MAG: hypothetical protein ABJZ55_20140 [Fuerstiella sp.]
MSIYSRRRRFVYSFAMAALLTTIYVGFRLASDMFLDVERRETRQTSLVRPDNVGTEAIQLARTWFPDTPWVGEARKQFYDSGRYLYCRDFSLINDDRSLKFEPIAMLWQSDDDKDPVTIVADSAQLATADKLSVNATEFGQITGGVIKGNVQIQGPNNLKITGSRFQIDQKSMKLFSSDPVRFQFETHEGVAPGGVDVFLSAAADSDGQLTDIDHISQVQLHGQVSCNFFVPATKPGREDVRLKILAAGGFTFDVDMKTCTFSGLSADGRGPRLNPKEEVWVRRTHDDGAIDELVCPELQLHFRNKVDGLTGKPIDDKIVLERLTAWGRSVTVASRSNNLIMQGTELHYSMDEGRFDLKHSDLDASGERRMVRVIRDGMTLQVPHVRVLTTEDQGFQRIECLGGGRMFGEIPAEAEKRQAGQATSPSKKSPKVASRFLVQWKDELTFKKLDAKSWLVQLVGAASVQESSRQIQLMGQQIQVRLEESSEPEDSPAGNNRVVRVSYPSATKAPELKGDFNLSKLAPRVMTAVGNVIIKTPEGSGTVRDRLVVKINDLLHLEQVDAEPNEGADSNKAKDDSEKVAGIQFATDRLEAIVNRPPKGHSQQKMQFESVWLKGAVTVARTADDPEKSFTAEGTMLQASSAPDQSLELKLFGDPAKVNSVNRKLEGPRIDLTEIDSHAEVVGSGRIRFYTDKGFDGEVLSKPAPLDIYWSDSMSFAKRSATFVGNIRIAMSDEETQDVEILCSGLKVFFSRDVALGKSEEDGSFRAFDKQSDTEAGPIDRIECMNRVTVSINQFEAEQHAARHRIEMVDLDLDLVSGDFTAIGPGYLESVSPDRDGTLQGSAPVSVRPNSPAATSQTAFVYVKAEFIGDIDGNLHHRVATLHQNVVALIAPARRVDEKISLDLIPVADLPEKAGLLRAEKVTLSVTDTEAFSLIARDNARLESQTLSASADVITYDHLKQQFIIRTEGDNDVIAVHRSAPGRPGNRLKGKRFEYYRRSNQLKADGIGGLQIGN